MEHDPIIADPTADPTVDGVLDESDEIEAQLIEDELLVEEISIDGMCGVY
jgi:mycofactocin precursor